jgi:hypothetical protein
MKKKNYSEGSLFGIPTKPEGYALGLIARCTQKSPTCLGFFFKPKYRSLPSLEQIQLNANDAVLVCWFGDLGLINGDWPIIGPLKNFKQDDWPVPLFRRIDLLDSTNGWLIEYPQNLPIFGVPIREIKVDVNSLAEFADEELFGSGALEITLSKLLQ